MDESPETAWPDPQDSPIGGLWGEFPDRYWCAFFGDENSYYMAELQRLRAGQSLDFRWAAFFLGMLWMMYRKLYIIAVCTLMLVLLESTLEQAVFVALGVGELGQSLIGMLINLAISIAMAYFANRVYLWDARRQIRQVLQELPHAHDSEIVAAIARKGGTSLGAVFVFIALLVAGIVALGMVAGSFVDLY